MSKEILLIKRSLADYFNNEKSVWISAICYFLAALLMALSY